MRKVHVLEGTNGAGRKWTGCGRLLAGTIETVGCAVLEKRGHFVTCKACRRRFGLERVLGHDVAEGCAAVALLPCSR
jgi:hypothetical protein